MGSVGFIFIGSLAMSYSISHLGVGVRLADFAGSLHIPPIAVMFLIYVVYIFLGCVMASKFGELQKLTIAEARKVYSGTLIDHFMNPRNLVDMENADGFARVTGPCGDTTEIWLKVKNGAIADASS